MNTYIKTACILFFSCAGPANATAQSDYESSMADALESFSEASSTTDFTAMASRFEEIGNTTADQWLPPYYAAYCQLVAGLNQPVAADRDRLYDKALAFVEAAESRSADNSEICALKGYIQYMRLSVDPQSRLYLISEAESLLDKATQLDPGNPRPDFIKGQNLFYTPEAYGGGVSAAKPLLEQAKEKFKAFEPVGAFAPDWGEKRCDYLLVEVDKAL